MYHGLSMGCHCIVCSTFVIRYIYDGTMCVCVCEREREREKLYDFSEKDFYFRVMLVVY